MKSKSILPSGAEVPRERKGVDAYQPIPGVSPQPRPGADLGDRDRLAAYIDRLMTDVIFSTKAVAGATVAIVKNGETLLVKGYGYADTEKRTPVDGDKTLFRIGSMSKLFTATAAMQLAEQGKLDLDADVNRYLDDSLRIPPAFGLPVTLKNLLTHTAGFEDSQFGTMVKKNAADLVPLEQNLREHRPVRVRPPVTNFNRGGDASYSSWGVALAGHIVARTSGMPFDDYVDEKIFALLGMTRSTFREPLPDGWEQDMSKGHAPKGDGTFTLHGFEYFHSIGPAGGATTTAADMARFMIAHLPPGNSNGRRLMGEETASLMHGRVLSPHPNVNGAGIGFYELHLNGRRIITHRGKTIFFPSKLVLFPQENIGVFLAFNSPLPSTIIRTFLEGFMKEYLPADPPAAASPTVSGTARRYAGNYFPNPHSYTKIDKFVLLVLRKNFEITVAATDDRTLRISNLVGPTSRWTEVETGVFQQAESQELIAFGADAQGKVSHLAGPMAFAPASKLARHETTDFHITLLGLALLGFLFATGGWSFMDCNTGGAATLSTGWATVWSAILGAVNIFALAVLWKNFLEPILLSEDPRIDRDAWQPAVILILIAVGILHCAYCGTLTGASLALAWAATLGTANIVALAAMWKTFQNPMPLLYEYPIGFRLALTLVLISISLTLGIVYWAALAWHLAYWNLFGRIVYTAIALLAVAFLWSLNHWNLVGYKFA